MPNRTRLSLLNIVLGVAVSALGFVACSFSPPSTAPPTIAPPTAIPLANITADAPATETTIAKRIFATLTAAVPTKQIGAPTVGATVTPPPPPNGFATAGSANAPGHAARTVPPPTLSLALSPSITPLPVLPTPSVAQAATAAPTLISRETLRGKILFKSARNGGKYPNNFQWFVMNADGSGVEQINAAPARALYGELKPQEGYSPDKKFLVLGETTCASNAHCDLYIGAPEVIAQRSQGQWTPGGPRWYRADNPVWSPDGGWIAFVWNRDNDRTKNIFKGQPFAQNQDFKRLTDFGGGRDTKNPTYSPDGASLAFATQDGPRWQIWVLHAAGENPADANARNLSNSLSDDWDPLWIK